jgi:hypothetical protein
LDLEDYVELPEIKTCARDAPMNFIMSCAAERADAMRQELMAAAWHPGRMQRWCLAFDDEFRDEGGGCAPLRRRQLR